MKVLHINYDLDMFCSVCDLIDVESGIHKCFITTNKELICILKRI